MTTRVWMLLILLLVCTIIWYVGKRRCKLLITTSLWSVIILSVFFIVGTIINLNTLKPKEELVIRESQGFEDKNIKIKGKDVYLKVKEEWVNIDDIKLISTFTKSYKIYYEGEEIEIESPGIKNSLKVMKKLGLVE